MKILILLLANYSCNNISKKFKIPKFDKNISKTDFKL